ncbi:hypothetical protein BTN90_13810, partial [Enterococcus faecium]|uniref:replication/maintenance protein RepL n=1 Tax=Enterococcus faecium TaxID=1352 RepID=UPI0009CD4ADA
ELAKLTMVEIIAKTLRQGLYCINPNFAINGDRTAFTTLIVRKRKNENETNAIQDGANAANETY